MYLQQKFAVILVLYSIELFGVYSYPALLPHLFNAAHEVKNVKRTDLGFPQIDEDVIELEHLKRKHDDVEHIESKRQNEPGTTDSTPPEIKNQIEEAVDDERQLELAMPSMSTTTIVLMKHENVEQNKQPQQPEDGLPRPPIVPAAHDDTKSAANKPDIAVPSTAKAFYGAARLAFGQNPEVLPTSSTSTTSTTATTTTKFIAMSEENIGAAVVTDIVEENPVELQQETADSATAISELSALVPTVTSESDTHEYIKHDKHNKETIGDILIDQLETIKSNERRSISQISPKTAQSLLRNPNGQYSSFDMAQYVFWTGDEAGVARAVEELIDENLITRENALKFLRDIRLGIEFLQRSYANRIFPEELRQNHLKRNSPPATTTPSTTTTSTTTTTTTEKSLPYLHLVQKSQTNAMGLGKGLDSFTFWNKVNELNNDDKQDIMEYDDATGRAKIAEFLYTEYTLEEILYKLAKVMFTQSLAQGSGEAQRELQKLTDFLEREGNVGVIPVDLQQKVLRVLLTALSDTLTEHPELLPAARVNLANQYYRLPMQTENH